MRRAKRPEKLGSSLRRFAGDREGVSAVEFAIVLPFMLNSLHWRCRVRPGPASSIPDHRDRAHRHRSHFAIPHYERADDD